MTGPLAPRVADCRSAAMLIKSALRIYLSVSYGMISILRIGSLRSPPPLVAGATKGGGISNARRAVVWFSTGESPVLKVLYKLAPSINS